MAREFAKHQFGMWSDDDFLSRPRFDKMLYGVLIDQPSFNQAGVAPINLRRLAKAMRDTNVEPTEGELLAAFARLEADRYVFLDVDTGEVLLRTMMRSDGVAAKPTVLVGALRKALQTESKKLRAVLRDEVARIDPPEVNGDSQQAKRLREQLPAMMTQIMAELPEWCDEMGRIDYAPETLSLPSARPSRDPLPDPLVESHKTPGDADPLETLSRPSRRPPVAVAVAVESPTEVVEFGSSRARVREADPDQSQPNPDPTEPPEQQSPSNDREPPTRCAAHRNLPADEPIPACGPCGNFRKAHDRWADRERRRAAERVSAEARSRAELRAAEIVACDLCDERGYVGTRVCDHDPEAAERNRRGAAMARAALAKGRDS